LSRDVTSGPTPDAGYVSDPCKPDAARGFAPSSGAAALPLIKHLVAGDPALARDRQQFVEIVGIEIADPP
jgi:hypothetical protein